ncbi:MAG: hypothetical protein OEL75_04415 [Kiritimatiellaceae bacterium]|nr:hypothetical protein [Kiritimatiellaceae bacterium]
MNCIEYPTCVKEGGSFNSVHQKHRADINLPYTFESTVDVVTSEDLRLI